MAQNFGRLASSGSTPRNGDDQDVEIQTPSATDIIPEALLRQAAGDSGFSQIVDRKSLCVVVEAGSADLVSPLEQLLDRIADWDYSVIRTRIEGKSDRNNASSSLIEVISGGGRVYGVATKIEQLPDVMVIAADLRIVIPPITSELVVKVVEAVTGGKVGSAPNLARLGFEEIVSCLRKGDSAEESIARLERASKFVHHVTPMPENVPPIEDLHGYGQAKEWGLELIEDLGAWRRGEIPFAEIDRAVILSSAPGLGKSSFVQSLAKSCQLPLVATSVGAWFSGSPGYLDSIVKEIDRVFGEASEVAPALLFLDEIDAIPRRATLSERHSSWWTPVITHLLTALDSTVSNKSDRLILVGATNHAERLDAALIRPGRLNKIINIGMPNASALVGIFRQHLGADLPDADLSGVAGLALGGTGADVVAWVRSARRAARTARRPMIISDLAEAVAPKDDRPRTLVERIAIHEAGHALAAHVRGTGVVRFVSIVPHGSTGGETMVENDGVAPSRADVEDLVVQQLAGRAAEEVLLGDPGTGSGGASGSDLARATRTLGVLHIGMGFGEDMIFRGDSDSVFSVLALNPRIADAIDADLRRLYGETLNLVRENVARIRAVADALIERRRIDDTTFLEILERSKPGDPMGGNSNG